MKTSMRLSLAALLVALGSVAAAQDYPSRTVTIIVPYPAGGPTDQLARVLAPKFSEKLGQNFIVENISGGGTTIATGRVARGAKDGHTLLLHNLQISANVALYPKLNFDTEKDLTPVAFINQNPLVLVGRKSLAANTLPELLALMKKTPGADGASRHRLDRPSRHVAARQGGESRGRGRALSRRGAGAAGHRRRACRSVLRHAAIGGADRRQRTDEGLWHHVEGDIAAVPEGREFRRCARAEARDLLLACPVRAGRNAEGRDRQAQRACCSACWTTRRSSRPGRRPAWRRSARISARRRPHRR